MRALKEGRDGEEWGVGIFMEKPGASSVLCFADPKNVCVWSVERHEESISFGHMDHRQPQPTVPLSVHFHKALYNLLFLSLSSKYSCSICSDKDTHNHTHARTPHTHIFCIITIPRPRTQLRCTRRSPDSEHDRHVTYYCGISARETTYKLNEKKPSETR
jgi:hypothetical protein